MVGYNRKAGVNGYENNQPTAGSERVCSPPRQFWERGAGGGARRGLT